VRALQGVTVRSVAPLCPPGCPAEAWLRYWPAMDLLPGVEPGGRRRRLQHREWSCLACGVPLIARAWPRKYDRQSLRAAGQAEACPASIDEAVSVVRACPGQAGRGPLPAGEFPNGAREAAEILEALALERRGIVSLLPTFLERYRDGDWRRGVGTNLVALGEGVRHELYYADAVAVAAETMYRARHNVELLIQRLAGWIPFHPAIRRYRSGCGPEHQPDGGDGRARGEGRRSEGRPQSGDSRAEGRPGSQDRRIVEEAAAKESRRLRPARKETVSQLKKLERAAGGPLPISLAGLVRNRWAAFR